MRVAARENLAGAEGSPHHPNSFDLRVEGHDGESLGRLHAVAADVNAVACQQDVIFASQLFDGRLTGVRARKNGAEKNHLCSHVLWW